MASRLFMLFFYSDCQAAVYSNATLACSLTVVLRDDGLPHWQWWLVGMIADHLLGKPFDGL